MKGRTRGYTEKEVCIPGTDCMQLYPGGGKPMRTIKKILAHQAGARLYHIKTGRLPASEELARLVDEGVYTELPAYKARGDVKTAAAVLAGDELHMDLGLLYQKLRKTTEKKWKMEYG